jgi:hypothetical protein
MENKLRQKHKSSIVQSRKKQGKYEDTYINESFGTANESVPRDRKFSQKSALPQAKKSLVAPAH